MIRVGEAPSVLSWTPSLCSWGISVRLLSACAVISLVCHCLACSSKGEDEGGLQDTSDLVRQGEVADLDSGPIGGDAALRGDNAEGKDLHSEVELGDMEGGDTTLAADLPAEQDTSDPPAGPAGPCPMADKVGRFEIADFEYFAGVTGTVHSGVIPLTVLLEVGSSGDCTLLNKTIPFCNPPCTPGDLCTDDGTCVPYPFAQSVGTVTITGLAQAVEMEPGPSNDYFDATLPSPPFEQGAPVVMSASGGEYQPFELEVEGVEPISGVDEMWFLDFGESLEVSWTPSDGPGRIYLFINVDQHGVSPTTLFCDTEDTGQLTIEAELMDQFLSLGVSGFAVGELRRRSIDSVSIQPGCVELSLFDGFKPIPVVGGHTACNSDADCPEGQKCNVMINTCIDE